MGGACFTEYRSLDALALDDEDTALEMLYRHRRVFAVGHGCSADWEVPIGATTSRVSTQTLPKVVVPPIVPREEQEPYLDMYFLGGSSNDVRNDIPDELRRFCDGYESWITAREAELPALDERFRSVGDRHLTMCRLALTRMRRGVDLLVQDDLAFEAFTLVNQVMLRQQYHSRLERRLADPWVPMPLSDDYLSEWSSRRGYWRAFQLAFLLITLPGVVRDDEVVKVDDKEISSKDIVDLIWFPTGGGKTEAYLGLAAFVILISRMREPDRNGCRVLMRYTLRVLTSQQFERAASMICACELLRRADPNRLGDAPIAIGLWVGMSLTPNDEAEALKQVGRLERRTPNAKNPFQLLSCPWCGTELDNPDRLGYAEYRRRQVFVCPNREGADGETCPFSTLEGHLPIKVVDDSIYSDPPSMIIGTVDKFAMLAWRSRAGAILVEGAGPDLIIQDELHLITGPLGSMVGLYEGAIDFLCSREGRPPKIVASTATIRRAEAQCRALYNRSVMQFPPPGLTASDSFFAKEDRSVVGRLYVGFLPTAASSPLTAQIRSVVALQQGVMHATGDGAPDELVDPYWTLIQYFGSLKELGRAATFTTADIPEFLPTMHRRYGLTGNDRRWMRTTEELTSRKNEEEIPKILKRLQVRYRSGAEWDRQALDTVLATNMISVGVDIDRLGLMMIVTQPKGTSEYIQASSRIGRSAAAPGLVFTLYSAGRPRDRSHYEQFKAYHEAFYRFVEPTSVTPFAPPAMERALHAVLVIGGRHVAGWSRPSDFDADDPEFAAFLQFIRDRARQIDPEHVPELNDLIDRIIGEWDARRPERWGDLSGDRDEPVLMRVAGTEASEDDRDSWETPTSMRNVDVECGAEVIHRYVATGEGER